jgi:hypothetical protein
MTAIYAFARYFHAWTLQSADTATVAEQELKESALCAHE